MGASGSHDRARGYTQVGQARPAAPPAEPPVQPVTLGCAVQTQDREMRRIEEKIESQLPSGSRRRDWERLVVQTMRTEHAQRLQRSKDVGMMEQDEDVRKEYEGKLTEAAGKWKEIMDPEKRVEKMDTCLIALSKFIPNELLTELVQKNEFARLSKSYVDGLCIIASQIDKSIEKMKQEADELRKQYEYDVQFAFGKSEEVLSHFGMASHKQINELKLARIRTEPVERQQEEKHAVTSVQRRCLLSKTTDQNSSQSKIKPYKAIMSILFIVGLMQMV